jgi:GH25 family lysozyme M1 (1,4-beta-N-acetylmuramidase)
MEGVDVSEHQGILSRDWFAQWDFAIIRAHTGYRYDHTFKANWNNAKGVTRRGVYAYIEGARPIEWQVQQTVEICRGDEPDLLYWIDAESHSIGLDETLRALREADRLVGHENVGLYTYVPYLRSPLNNDGRLAGWPLWIAGYGRNDGARYPLNPGPPWSWVIHQYTSANGLDRNYAPNLDFAQDQPTDKEEDEVKGVLVHAPGSHATWVLNSDGTKTAATSRRHVDLLTFFNQVVRNADGSVLIFEISQADIDQYPTAK